MRGPYALLLYEAIENIRHDGKVVIRRVRKGAHGRIDRVPSLAVVPGHILDRRSEGPEAQCDLGLSLRKFARKGSQRIHGGPRFLLCHPVVNAIDAGIEIAAYGLVRP